MNARPNEQIEYRSLGNALGHDGGNVYCRAQSCGATNRNDLHVLQISGLQAQLIAKGYNRLPRLNTQASSGRWMSLKLRTLFVSNLSMILRQTTHLAASPSFLGTSDGVAV